MPNTPLLKHLHLEHNQISTVPETFLNLPNLSDLYLDYNQIQTLPQTFQLPRIQDLRISHNQLSEIPAAYLNIFRFDFSHNPMKAPHQEWEGVPPPV